MIKLFAADLDGTLLNAFHKVDRTVARSIRAVTDAGYHMVIATGRTMLSNREHGFDGLPVEICCANGSIIVGREGVLKTFTVSPELLEEMIPAFPDVCFECVTLDGMFASASREVREAGFAADPPLRRIAMRGMRAAQSNSINFDVPLARILELQVCKVNCRVGNPSRASELHAFIDEHADLVVNAPFSPVMFELTDPAVNKGASVAWLARHFGYTEDEVAVYGDGGNDIVMLDRFEHAYATSNGSDAAKQAAGTVIGNCAFHAVPRHMMATVRAQRRAFGYTRIE